MFATLPRGARLLGRILIILVVLLILADRFGPDSWAILPLLTGQIYTWVLILGAFSLLLGIGHVAWVHGRRIQRGEAEWPLSLALVAGLATVLALGIVGGEGTRGVMVGFVFDSVIAPGQATLFALLAFFMAGAAYRLLRVNRTGGACMLAGAVLMILAQLPLTGRMALAGLHPVADWLVTVPVMAVLRGVLLGTGLAALITGLGTLLNPQ